jgi:hypothetical protein
MAEKLHYRAVAEDGDEGNENYWLDVHLDIWLMMMVGALEVGAWWVLFRPRGYHGEDFEAMTTVILRLIVVPMVLAASGWSFLKRKAGLARRILLALEGFAILLAWTGVVVALSR